MADLSITAANVVAGAGASIDSGTAGATITAGQVLYKDSTDSNKLKLADANASLAASTAAGIALHASLSGQPIKYLTAGLITIGATTGIGTVYVVSATAGGIALGCPGTTDLVTGMYTCILGVATTAAIIDVSIKHGGVAVP